MDPVAIGLIAAVVVGYGLVSRRLSTTTVSAPMVFVTAGLLLGSQGVGAVDFEVEQGLVEGLIEATLVLVLFTDATRIDLGELRPEAALPSRLLGFGMPLTIVAGTLAGLSLFPDLPLFEAALLAAMLAPTDAALGQAVVSSPRVPARVRQTLNVESGLNDGIALPVVTVLLALTAVEVDPQDPGFWTTFVLKQIGFGVSLGALVGGVGGWIIDRASRRDLMDGTFQQLATLALAAAAWAGAESLDGNGFLAAFVAGLAFGVVARAQCPHIEEFTEDEGQLLTLLTFLVFGGAFVGPALGELTWRTAVYALLSLTAVRMIPVAVSLLGAGLKPETIGFLGWFGPRGLASILFLVIVVEEQSLAEPGLLMATVTWVVLLSVFAHGITANPAASWYRRRYAAMSDRATMPESAPVHEHALRVPLRDDRGPTW